METAHSFLVAILLRQIWPIVDQSNHNFQNPSLHFSVTLKLIAFTLTCHQNHIDSLLCIALESELPKIIIIGTHLSDIPAKYHIFRNVRNYEEYNAISRLVGALRFSPHAENSLIDLRHPFVSDAVMTSELFQLNSDFKSAQSRGRIQFPYNMSPQRVHHILIGTKAQLVGCFKQASVRVLQYKTGVVTGGTSHLSLGNIMVERYLENSRESAFVLMSVSNFGMPYSDRFGLLRNRKLIVQSYASPCHILYDDQQKPAAGLTYTETASALVHLASTGGQWQKRMTGRWQFR